MSQSRSSVWRAAGAGRLDPQRRKALESCVADLDRVVPLRNDQREKSYYERLRKLATLALGIGGLLS